MSYFFATSNFWVSVVESLKFQIILFHTFGRARVFIISSYLLKARGTQNHLYSLKFVIFSPFWIKRSLCNNRSQQSEGGGWYQLSIYIVIACGRKGRGAFFLKSVVFRRYNLFVFRGGSGVAQGWLRGGSGVAYYTLVKIDIWTRMIRNNINIILIFMTGKRSASLILIKLYTTKGK